MTAAFLNPVPAYVVDLQPGDRVTIPSIGNSAEATFITQMPHPKWPHLRLVVWAFEKGHPLGLRHSFDALDAHQYVGDLILATALERMEHLKKLMPEKPA